MDDHAAGRGPFTARMQNWLEKAREHGRGEAVEDPVKLQAALSEIENLLNEGQPDWQALHWAPEGYLRTDRAGQVMEVNQAAARLLKSKPEDLTGKELILWVAPEDQTTFSERYEQLLSWSEAGRIEDAGGALTWETCLLTGTGERREVEITAIPVQAQPNQGMYWWVRDIRAKKQVQKSIYRREVILQTLADQTPIAILIARKNEIIFANPAAAQIIGFRPEELLAKDLLSLIHPHDHVIFQSLLADHPEAQEPLRAEARLQTQSSNDCWADITLSLFHLEGENFWLLTAYDITPRVLAERGRKELLSRLVTVQEEERMRLARELHDQMGQNLTALMLGLKSLEAYLPAGESNQKRLRQLFDLINDLTQEVHRIALDLRPTSLDDIGLDSALANYIDDWAERNNILVDYEVTSLPNFPVPTPIATAIYRIVQETLTNIIKHANAKHVSIIVSHRPRQIRVILEDDGCGFEVDKKMRSSEGRQSLGLLGMKERAELAGGRLLVESEEGKGTTVYVQFPLTGEAETGA